MGLPSRASVQRWHTYTACNPKQISWGRPIGFPQLAGNTKYICDKARQKLWLLRRMIQLDLDKHSLFDAYTKEIRSILELAVPVWHSSLTKKQSLEIERIQKVSFKIILGSLYVSYIQACKYFHTQSLEERRTKLCLKVAKKNLKSENCLFTKLEKLLTPDNQPSLFRNINAKLRDITKVAYPT